MDKKADLLRRINEASVEECKKILRFSETKALLREHWDETYPGIAPGSTGEMMQVVKFGDTPVCEHGSHRNFKQFPKGFFNACKEESCKCLSDTRSTISVEAAKALTPEKIAKSREKAKQTCIEKYGYENPFLDPTHSEKTRAAHLKRYGQPTLQGIAEVQEKTKQTSLDRYGVEHYSQSEEYRDLVTATSLEKYGVPNHITASPVAEKRAATLLNRYGVDNYFKHPEHQSAIRDKLRAETGCSNVGQTRMSAEAFALLQDKEMFSQTVAGKSYEAAADLIGTSAFTVARYAAQYSLVDTMKIGTGSVMQDRIQSWLESLGVTVVANTRKIIPPKEIDLYLPDYRLGIEFNGIYFHCEMTGSKSPHYHRSKYEHCTAAGIGLIQVCSTVYRDKPEIVKGIILSRLGMNRKIAARKCSICEVSFDDARDFLSQNHLQTSSTTGSVRIGLYFEDELVSLMTFGKRRTSMGGKHETGSWELIRLVSKIGTTVVGGSGKMFSHFLKQFTPAQVISYTDLRYFTGSSMLSLGFKRLADSGPGYWYTDFTRVYHRYNFTKRTLVEQGNDPSKTEWQIMQELGYDRLWDCGNAKYLWTSLNNEE